MTTVSNPLLIASASNFTVYKEGSTYYGMTRTGVVTHNTNAADLINDCIESLTASRTWKEKVLLRGDIEIDSPIVMDSYTILQLDGKVTLADNADCSLLEATGKSNFEILGGDWDGNEDGQTVGTALVGFSLDTCTDFFVDSVTLHEVYKSTAGPGHGIYLILCSNGTVKNCTIYDCGSTGAGTVDARGGSGVHLSYSSKCKIMVNTIYECGGGITARTVSGVSQNVIFNQFLGNLIHDIQRSGIILFKDVSGVLQRNRINNNTIYDIGLDGAITSKAIRLYNCSYNVVTGNILYQTSVVTQGGIYVYGSYNNIGNNIIDQMQNSIILASSDGNVCLGNTIHNSNIAGIGLTNNANYCVVAMNFIDTTTTHGIWLEKSANAPSYNNIIGNTINDPGDDWINIDDVLATANNIGMNNLVGTSGGGGTAIDNSGTGTIAKDNVGYTNEAVGSATILNGQTAIVVTHGLINGTTKLTPTKVIVTGSTADTNALYVDTIGDTTFTINAAGAVGGNRTVYWYAKA